MNESSLNIYLAGKISPHGWRELIVGDSLNASDNTSGSYKFQQLIDAGIEDMSHGHNYCGPFFVECDHACGHGTQNHGVVFECWGDGGNRPLVFETCKKGIKSSDVVFCWVEDDFFTAYGSIWELGYAYALGKPIYIGIQKDIALTHSPEDQELIELWFPFSSGNCIGLFDDAGKAFDFYFGAHSTVMNCKNNQMIAYN